MSPTPGKVSILIPSRNERFLQRTVEDVLTKAGGDIEVIPVLDGYWPTPPLVEDPRVVPLHKGQAQGMRPAINDAARLARGEYLLKLDAHCMVAEGFDLTLKADCADDWVVVPRRYSLDAETWAWKETGKAPVDAHFLSYPFEEGRAGRGLHGTPWNDRQRARLQIPLDDEMSSQGSCWFMTRAWWNRRFPRGLSSEGYGNFVQEFQEIGCTTWQGGGAVKINKRTWYAHLHKGKEYGRGYFISKSEMSDGAKYCVDFWLNDRWTARQHDFRWQIERFWPVPGWPTKAGALDWDEVRARTTDFTAAYQAGQPVGI